MLTNANLTGAVVTGAHFDSPLQRLHQGAALLDGQLPGEESGRNRLGYNDLSGWDFSGQVVTGAKFL